MSTWNLDLSHSAIQFSVRHMVVSKVRGRFAKFEGSFAFDGANPAAATGTVTIDVASIDTGVGDRDNHLRSPDFFDVTSHPAITFASKRIEKLEGESYRVHGDLTVRGTTKEVALELEYGGATRDPWGMDRLGFSGRTSINRKDFGLTWSQLLETGGAIVGDRIDIEFDCEAVKAS